MPQATNSTGNLNQLQNCYIAIPNANRTIYLKVLPEITDSKQASYSDAAVIGRAMPLKTYSHSENRTISMSVHFIVCTSDDITNNLNYLRALESLVYPDEGGSSVPYLPPPICSIQCGKLLSDGPLCVILKGYQVRFDPTVAWDETTYLPYKVDVDLTWEVVYDSADLPGQTRIMNLGA